MTKLCARGKSAAKRKFKVYPSAYANAYASKICAGKAKDPSGVKRKDWGPKKKKEGGEINYGKQPKDKMKTKPYGIENRKIKIEKLLSRKDSEILRKEKGIGLYASPSKSYSGLYPSPKKKKDGGEMTQPLPPVEQQDTPKKFKDTIIDKAKKFKNKKPIPGDPRKKRKYLIDIQNPISEYGKKGKLKYTAANKGKIMKVASKLEKASKAHAGQAKTLKSLKLVRGGGIAIRGLNFQGVK